MKKSLFFLTSIFLISSSPSWSMADNPDEILHNVQSRLMEEDPNRHYDQASREDQECSCWSSVITFLWEGDSDSDVPTTQGRPRGFREEESCSFCKDLQVVLAAPSVFLDDAAADPEQYFLRLRTRLWGFLGGDFFLEDTGR